MKVFRISASFLAIATLGYTGFKYGSELFLFLVPMAGGSLFVLIITSGLVPRAKLRLESALISYALLAVASLIALTALHPVAEGGAILLAFAAGGSLLALRASYVSARRRRYDMTSYYG
jgi:hypothetical protein